ncbi:unnamed protein product [Mytilus coruscus]|uniref:Uncharacterized protein n=1 Tax=Mytilus coruscus TaxID=42192 RepID=A0A6J8APP4_MYTCO|nr:unnamed protein product [Mytilus coruscus]
MGESKLPDLSLGESTIIDISAGKRYKEILKVLLNDFRKIKVDQKSKAGFTALMKAAIQGRTACAKLILFAGANPRLRDNGRKLTAEEWARFTNRHECADEIAKFTKLKRCLFGGSKKIHKRSNSEPDLIIAAEKNAKNVNLYKDRNLNRSERKLRNSFHGVMTRLHPLKTKIPLKL